MAEGEVAWRRDRQVNVRVNDYEWETIQHQAKLWGCAPVEYMRLVAIGWGTARVRIIPSPRHPGVGPTIEQLQAEGWQKVIDGWWKHPSELRWVKFDADDPKGVPLAAGE